MGKKAKVSNGAAVAPAATAGPVKADVKGKGKAAAPATEIDDIFAGKAKTTSTSAGARLSGATGVAVEESTNAAFKSKKQKKRKREPEEAVATTAGEGKEAAVSLRDLEVEKARRNKEQKPVEVIDDASAAGLPGATTSKKPKRTTKPPPKQTEDDEIFKDSRGTSNRTSLPMLAPILKLNHSFIQAGQPTMGLQSTTSTS